MLRKYRELVIAGFIILLTIPRPCAQTLSQNNTKTVQPGIVYFIRAVDTEASGLDSRKKSQKIIKRLREFDKIKKADDLQETPSIKVIMEEEFRNSLRDSFGNKIKFTWFILAMEPYCNSLDGDCNIIYSAMVDGIKGEANFEGWSEEIEKYGDDIELHYHHMSWSDLNEDGIFHWNQLLSFDESNAYHLRKMLNHLLIEKNFFPSAFRSGWVWEDNGLSEFLEEWIPFDLGIVPNLYNPWKGHEPRANIYDWRGAPRKTTFYHPSIKDYRREGNMKRLMLNSKGYQQEEINQAFRKASLGEDQFICLYSHVNSDGLVLKTEEIYESLQISSKEYGIPFRFVTAKEAARAHLKTTDTTSPRISIVEKNGKLLIKVSEEVYQDNPYLVLKYYDGSYKNKIPLKNAELNWSLELSELEGVCKIGIAITDISSNVGTLIYKLKISPDKGCEEIKKQ